MTASVLLQLEGGLLAHVDAADMVWLLDARFTPVRSASKRLVHYVMVARDGERVLLHRLLMHAPPGMVVDHINGDGLDNRRSNLRLVTREQNGQNQHRGSAALSVGVVPKGVPLMQRFGGGWRVGAAP